MTKLEVEVLSDVVNATVVRLPGRVHPGIVIQGDTLKSLLDEVVEAREQTDPSEAQAALRGLEDRLNGYLAEYESSLRQHGLGLPYQRKP